MRRGGCLPVACPGKASPRKGQWNWGTEGVKELEVERAMCSRQRKLHVQRLWGGKGLGVFKMENPKSKTNISQNKGWLSQWNIFSVMKNSKQCLPFCLPPSLPASLCCGLVKGFLVSPLLSLLKRRCPFHVERVDHVGEEPGGSRLGLTDDLPDSVDGPWGCWACPGISWRS